MRTVFAIDHLAEVKETSARWPETDEGQHAHELEVTVSVDRVERPEGVGGFVSLPGFALEGEAREVLRLLSTAADSVRSTIARLVERGTLCPDYIDPVVVERDTDPPSPPEPEGLLS